VKIGIISDSHDHHENVLKVVEIFKSEGVKYILHAGDIISAFTASAFGQVKDARFVAIFGNTDAEKVALKAAIEAFGGEIHDDPYSFEVDGHRIFMTHKPTLLDEIIASGKYDLVVYGHTHIQDIRKQGHTVVINPGELTDWLTGSGSAVILETDDMSCEIKNLAQSQ